MSKFSVATFNVNSVRSRLHVLEKWLARDPVDVLCLQETKTMDESFPSEFFTSLGYEVMFSGEKGYNGVAIASRFPFEEVIYGFGDGKEPGLSTRFLQAKVSGIWMINSYVPQGKSIDHPDYQLKLAFLERVRELLIRRYDPSGRVIWMGDLNVAPTDIDVTEPGKKRDHVCFHQTVKDAFARVTSWGFVDLFRKYRPGEGEFSFWDYRVKNSLERNIGWRIDHILVTPSMKAMSRNCFVDRELRGWDKPSDHAPVVGVFELEHA